jgi:creatinine amidohydrolase
MSRPFILAETNWKAVKATPFDIAILPWGATEAHNYHLPYATDTIQCDHVAAEAARQAWEAGARVIVLPTVPFGVQTGQLDIPLCINMNPATQAALLADIAHSLDGQGIHKLVVLNGHGGNDFRQMIRELQPRTKVFLSAVSWYKVINPKGHFTDLGDHAGELETSVMMHIAPELVLPLSESGDGRERKPKIAAMREGWAWAPRRWTQVSADTGIGDPRAATAEKGRTYLVAICDRFSRFLIDLANTNTEELYERAPN